MVKALVVLCCGNRLEPMACMFVLCRRILSLLLQLATVTSHLAIELACNVVRWEKSAACADGSASSVLMPGRSSLRLDLLSFDDTCLVLPSSASARYLVRFRLILEAETQKQGEEDRDEGQHSRETT